MTESHGRITPPEPDVVERECGGWLAVAPAGSAFSIGVTAPTYNEAQAKFGFVFQRWLEIVAGTRNPNPG